MEDKMEKIKLNIGCGVDIKKEFINIDTHKRHGADIIHTMPQLIISSNEDGSYKTEVIGKELPFEENTVDYIYCSRMMEDFLYEYIPIMQDFHRVLKKGGILHIIVPYGLDVRNPRHIRYFDETSFDEFTRKTDTQYLQGHVPIFKLIKINKIRKNHTLIMLSKFLTRRKVKTAKKKGKKLSSTDEQNILTKMWRFILTLTPTIKSIEIIMKK